MVQSNEWTTENKKKKEATLTMTTRRWSIKITFPASLDVRTCSVTDPDKRESHSRFIEGGGVDKLSEGRFGIGHHRKGHVWATLAGGGAGWRQLMRNLGQGGQWRGA